MLLMAGADAPDFMSQLFRPSTIMGLALYGSAAFLYIVALRKILVSVAFPALSLSYAIVAVLGHFLFGEPFGIMQIGGIALIVGGVVSSTRREGAFRGLRADQVRDKGDGILTITLNRRPTSSMPSPQDAVRAAGRDGSRRPRR